MEINVRGVKILDIFMVLGVYKYLLDELKNEFIFNVCIIGIY